MIPKNVCIDEKLEKNKRTKVELIEMEMTKLEIAFGNIKNEYFITNFL